MYHRNPHINTPHLTDQTHPHSERVMIGEAEPAASFHRSSRTKRTAIRRFTGDQLCLNQGLSPVIGPRIVLNAGKFRM